MPPHLVWAARGTNDLTCKGAAVPVPLIGELATHLFEERSEALDLTQRVLCQTFLRSWLYHTRLLGSCAANEASRLGGVVAKSETLVVTLTCDLCGKEHGVDTY